MAAEECPGHGMGHTLAATMTKHTQYNSSMTYPEFQAITREVEQILKKEMEQVPKEVEIILKISDAYMAPSTMERIRIIKTWKWTENSSTTFFTTTRLFPMEGSF